MRTFVAIKISVDYKLEMVISSLRRNLAEERIKWIDLNKLHLTLFFLGETPESQINPISSGLKQIIEEIPRFELSFTGLGLFKSITDPRVIWIGVDYNKRLEQLQKHIQDYLVNIGYQSDNRPFRPHLTVGRPKGIKNHQKVEREIKKYKDQPIQKTVVEEVTFYESVLKKWGPEYRPILRSILKQV